MRNVWPLLLCVLASAGLVVWSGRTPSPAAANAPPAVFSAGRAMADVQVIAGQPDHVIGTTRIETVRRHITARLAGLALDVSRRPGVGISTDRRAPGFAAAGEVQNIVGELPGTHPELPAVLIMAHYDTVPHSPGAGDDTAGVSAAIEIARALKASGPHRRTVLFLFTDGEEPGLLGSAAFFAEDPLRKRVGVVLNLEARGDRGRAAMFEVSPGTGDLVAFYAAHAPSISADSLATTLYHLAPNNTDLTNALTRNYPGMNFAFTGDEASYHTALMTPARLDLGSVQDMGDQVLATARGLADVARLPTRGPDRVYSDIPGGRLIVYPVWLNWLLLVAAGAMTILVIVRARRRERLFWGGLARSVGLLPLFVVANALALQLDGRLVKVLARNVSTVHPLLERFDLLWVGGVLLVIGVSALLFVALVRGAKYRVALVALLAAVTCSLLGGFDPLATGLAVAAAALALATLWKPASLWSGWSGVITFGLALALALQILIPLGAHLVIWPLLLSASAAAVLAWVDPDNSSLRARFIALAGGAPALVLIGSQASGFFTAMGPGLPLVMAPFAGLAALALFPLAWAWTASWRPGIQGSGALALGLTTLAWCGVAATQATAQAPQMTEVFYLADLDSNRFYRASGLPRLDGWAESALAAAGDRPRQVDLTPLFDERLWVARAAPAPLRKPEIRLEASPLADGQRLTLHVRGGNGGRAVWIMVKSAGPLRGVTVQDRPAGIDIAAAQWGQVRYYAPGPQGVTLSFSGPAHGALEVRTLEARDGWPDAAPAPSPRPAHVLAWRNADTTWAADRAAFTW
ncbi:MAG: M20/M25/M40 family metallo-hydrolase [Caulobacterales bacterium]|nr:M20/M25/M40 family metallo-hydrolase [Caulobacterales bacterium]